MDEPINPVSMKQAEALMVALGDPASLLWSTELSDPIPMMVRDPRLPTSWKACGKTREEALANLKDARVDWFYGLLERIRRDTFVYQRTTTDSKGRVITKETQVLSLSRSQAEHAATTPERSAPLDGDGKVR